MSNLLDENQRPVPICNILDADTGARFYVGDKPSYEKNIDTRNKSKSITMVTAGVLALFLCIFSLNFGSSGWTAGNMLTFGIVMGTLLVVAFYGSKWNESHAIVSRSQSDGVPCSSKPVEGAGQVIHCGRQAVIF